MLFDNTDFNYEIGLFKIPGTDFKMEKQDDKFLSPEEAFLRGNIEKNTYVPYKQYTYFKLKPENEQESMLLKIMAYTFAINELNLYLDLHPEETKTFEKFKNYITELNELETTYTNKYGPLTINQTNKANFNWLNNPWPWDKKGGSMYV